MTEELTIQQNTPSGVKELQVPPPIRVPIQNTANQYNSVQKNSKNQHCFLHLTPYNTVLKHLQAFCLWKQSQNHPQPIYGAWLSHRHIPTRVNSAVFACYQLVVTDVLFLESEKLAQSFGMLCEETELDYIVVEGPLSYAFSKLAKKWVRPQPWKSHDVVKASQLENTTPQKLCILVNVPMDK